MELQEALRQIADIHRQMARVEVFRGYRSATVGATGILALAGAAVQGWWVPHPEADLGRYLGLWVTMAVGGVGLAAIEMGTRARAAGPGLSRQLTRLAVEQFVPSLAVGAVLTACVVGSSPESAWLLPGLWALVFSLGVFASRRLLPEPVLWVGVYYVVSGGACLLCGGGAHALAPWQMALTFGVGQLLGAAILHQTLERSDGTPP
jgi:hypothetical protein